VAWNEFAAITLGEMLKEEFLEYDLSQKMRRNSQHSRSSAQ
jgi:hypothetical protein